MTSLLSPNEISNATGYLISTRDALLHALSGFDAPQWDFKPDPGRWSIAEILEHIVLVENRIHAIVGGMQDAPPAEAGRNDEQIDEFVMTAAPQRSPKFQSPPRFEPSHQWSPAEALDRFNESRARTLHLLVEAPSLRGHVLPHPIFGPWDGYQWILAAGAHLARHTSQILEVKACAGLPELGGQRVFAGLALARRLEDAEGSAGASFVQARGGDAVWTRIAGAYAMFDGVGSPLTQTFGLGMFEPATDLAIAQLEDFFRTRGAAVDHEVSPLAGVALIQSLTSRGYVPLELSSVLFLNLTEGRPDPPLNFALTIRVASSHDRDAYAHAAAEGWSEAGELAHQVADLGRVLFAANGYVGFLVERNGRIIATAGLAIHNRVALLAGASTIPEARGLGAQRAVLAARLRYAVEEGCDLAMMVTEPGSASQRNAERHGFRVAYTRTKWRLDAAQRAPSHPHPIR
jgi:hypothetical protein